MNNFFESMSMEQLELADKILHIISPFLIAAAVVILGVPYFISRKRKKEIIRKSEENNTFVTARLVRKRRIMHKGESHGFDYECIYEYNVNGETKERRICFNGRPPDEIRLYPKNGNSGKLISNAGHEDNIWLAIPLLCLAAVIVMILLAMLDTNIEDLIRYKNKFG